MITDRDMREQVKSSLTSEVGDFDVNAIVDDLQDAYGTVHIDEIPSERYWEIVEKHDKHRDALPVAANPEQETP